MAESSASTRHTAILRRKQFARDHGVDLEHGMMTLTEFLELTKDAYGGDVIRKVIDRMEA